MDSLLAAIVADEKRGFVRKLDQYHLFRIILVYGYPSNYEIQQIAWSSIQAIPSVMKRYQTFLRLGICRKWYSVEG